MSAQNDPSYNLLILPNPKICRDPVDKETDFEQKKKETDRFHRVHLH